MSMRNQYGGGLCSSCGSLGTNKTTCPLTRPRVKNPKPEKHPLAFKKAPPVPVISPAPVQGLEINTLGRQSSTWEEEPPRTAPELDKIYGKKIEFINPPPKDYSITGPKDCRDCQPDAFVQNVDLCWFHAASVALLFSNASHKFLWNTIFTYDKTSQIPIQLQQCTAIKPAAVLALEIMRRSLELSMKQSAATKPVSGRTLSPALATTGRRMSINLCTKGTLDIICSLSNWCLSSTTHQGQERTQLGGYADRLLDDLQVILPMTVTRSYGKDSKFSTPSDAIIVRYETKTGGGHFITLFKCNDTWRYFNNEDRTGQVLRSIPSIKVPETEHGTTNPLKIMECLRKFKHN